MQLRLLHSVKADVSKDGSQFSRHCEERSNLYKKCSLDCFTQLNLMFANTKMNLTLLNKVQKVQVCTSSKLSINLQQKPNSITTVGLQAFFYTNNSSIFLKPSAAGNCSHKIL